jgi:hypothetical protein
MEGCRTRTDHCPSELEGLRYTAVDPEIAQLVFERSYFSIRARDSRPAVHSAPQANRIIGPKLFAAATPTK